MNVMTACPDSLNRTLYQNRRWRWCTSISLFWKSASWSHIPYPTRPVVIPLLLPSTYLFISFKEKIEGLLQAYFFSLLASQRNHKRDWKWESRRERLFSPFSFFFSILLPLFFSQCFFSFLSLGASHV